MKAYSSQAPMIFLTAGQKISEDLQNLKHRGHREGKRILFSVSSVVREYAFGLRRRAHRSP